MCGGVLWYDKKERFLWAHDKCVLWCTVEVVVKGASFCKAVGNRVVAVPECVHKSLCVHIFSSSEKNVVSFSAVLAKFALCPRAAPRVSTSVLMIMCPMKAVSRIQARPAKLHFCLC